MRHLVSKGLRLTIMMMILTSKKVKGQVEHSRILII